jgi:hypothetical protein
MAVHEGLVHAVVRKRVLVHLPYAEVLQAGRIGLWRAILGYDPLRGIAGDGGCERWTAPEGEGCERWSS